MTFFDRAGVFWSWDEARRCWPDFGAAVGVRAPVPLDDGVWFRDRGVPRCLLFLGVDTCRFGVALPGRLAASRSDNKRIWTTHTWTLEASATIPTGYNSLTARHTQQPHTNHPGSRLWPSGPIASPAHHLDMCRDVSITTPLTLGHRAGVQTFSTLVDDAAFQRCALALFHVEAPVDAFGEAAQSKRQQPVTTTPIATTTKHARIPFEGNRWRDDNKVGGGAGNQRPRRQ